ncbi:YezD family protein [Paenibacillus sp. GD4]|jgi:hypothetical protein|uniref:YezD family protein n=1 Tax=Paenibacillus sp. GD4 TaxID=3068890 RepID=UPI002796BFE9|nr:YezD family protein [Paenibacillus sp. GD4]MDQ1909136.1 YezD family protein [Paenibacillus sp. GD4]
MAKPLDIDEVWSKRILQSVNGLEYGTVQIIVHDGRIVQIERTERKRFDSEHQARQNTVVRNVTETKQQRTHP